MTFAELTQTDGWKNFMAKLYGLGAAVVIVGALFKIMHWPGAGPMLVVGLSVEAIIFTFSAFEPLHADLDWSLVYPELAHDPKAAHGAKKEEKKVAAAPKGTPLTDKLENALENAGLKQDVFEKLGAGLANLTKTAAGLSDISQAASATNEYTTKVKAAADSAGTLADAYKQGTAAVNQGTNAMATSFKQSSEALTFAVDSLSDTYQKTNQKIGETSTKFLTEYQKLTSNMNLDFSHVAKGNEEYVKGVAALNKNLTALNAIFELQMQEADLEKMMVDLNGAVQESNKYYAEVKKLGTRLEALNTVYGNMLTAMNVNLKG